MAEIIRSHIVMYERDTMGSASGNLEARLVHELSNNQYALQGGPIGWKIISEKEFRRMQHLPWPHPKDV